MTGRALVLGIVLASPCLVFACGSEYGSVDSPSDEAGGSNGDASVEGSALLGCGPASVCVRADNGWSPVVKMNVGTSPCQVEYPIVEDISTSQGFTACSCKCNPAAGGCDGSLTLSGGGGTCTGSTTTVNFPSPGGIAECVRFTPPTTPTPIRLTPTAQAPSGCAPTLVTVFPPIEPFRTCSGAPAEQGSCPAGHLCMPVAVGSGDNCIKRAGDVACPDDYRRRSLAGTDPVDTRSCTNNCACATQGCGTGELTPYSSVDCSGTALTKLVSNGQCTQGATLATAQSGKFNPALPCRVTTNSTLQGAVSYGKPQTICCPQQDKN